MMGRRFSRLLFVLYHVPDAIAHNAESNWVGACAPRKRGVLGHTSMRVRAPPPPAPPPPPPPPLVLLFHDAAGIQHAS